MPEWLTRWIKREPPKPQGSGPLFDAVVESLADVQDYARSHGGEIVLIAVTPDNDVRIKFRGACAGCPMAGITFRVGIENQLKARFPEIRRVVLVI